MYTVIGGEETRAAGFIHPGTAEGRHTATNQRPENSDSSPALSESLRLIPVVFLNGGIWIERGCGTSMTGAELTVILEENG